MSDFTQSLRKSALPPRDPQKADSGQSPAPLASPTEGTEVSVTTDSSRPFSPSKEQCRVKARFWARWSENPFADLSTLTWSQMSTVAQSSALQKWSSQPGFRDWFLNANEADENFSYLTHLAVNAAEDLLLNTDPKTQGARAQLVKSILSEAVKLKQAELEARRAGALGQVDSMNQDELIQLLQKAGLSVTQLVTLPPTKE